MSDAAFGILSRPGKNGLIEYLLVVTKHDYGEYTGHWYPAGGAVDAGESDKDCVVREIKEELDIDVEAIRKIAEYPGDLPGIQTHWWECRMKDPTQIISLKVSELAAYRWVSEDVIKNGTLPLWPATRKIFEEYLLK